MFKKSNEMRALYTREDLASIMNRNATTIHEHIKKLGIKPFKRKNRFMMYDDSVIDLLNNSINKREITKYYPMKTTETFWIFQSKMNEL